MKKIFITSSNTNSGKTLFTCALADSIKQHGYAIHALKPVITGFDYNSLPNDIFYICGALGIKYDKKNIQAVNLYAYDKPLSPDMAARKEKKSYINYDKLLDFCSHTKEKNDYLLVETAGGIMVPLNPDKTNLDLIREVADITILVVGSYLGSLSHTLSSYKLLCDQGRKPKLLAVMQNLGKSDQLYIPVLETVKSLEKFVATPIIGIEKLTGAEPLKISKLSKILSDAKILKILG